MDDAELLRRLLSGDQQAFADIVRRHHATLVRVARVYVGSYSTAEDVAQETWMAVVRGIERFEQRSSFKTWLLRICVNRARSIGSREHRSVPVDPTESTTAVDGSRFGENGMWTTPPRSFTDLVDGRVANELVIATIRRTISELPEPARAVVTLRDVEGLSTAEVADLLGLSEANVRVVLHRGRAKVRAALDEIDEGGNQ